MPGENVIEGVLLSTSSDRSVSYSSHAILSVSSHSSPAAQLGVVCHLGLFLRPQGRLFKKGAAEEGRKKCDFLCS